MGFEPGKKVISLSDWFPYESPHESGNIQPPIHPKKGEILEIDFTTIHKGETFLGFIKYNFDGDTNWWHSCKFKLIDDIPITMDESIFEKEPEFV